MPVDSFIVIRNIHVISKQNVLLHSLICIAMYLAIMDHIIDLHRVFNEWEEVKFDVWCGS